MSTPAAPENHEMETDGEDVEETQVLTFTIGDETYCVSIDYVAEIVDGEGITELPDSADHVEGVMNLRENTTTIVNPSTILETKRTELLTDGGHRDHRLVVLDSESVETDSPIGWVVSEVHEVKTIADEVVDTDAIGETDLLRGLISEEEGFTIWSNPSQFVA